MSLVSHRHLTFLKLGLVASALAASPGAFAADADKGGFGADFISNAFPALAPIAQQLDRMNGQLGNPVDHAAAAALNSYVPGAGQALEAGWALQRGGTIASNRSPMPASSNIQVGYQPSQPVMGYQPPNYYGSNVQTNYRAAGGYGGQTGYPAYPAYGEQSRYAPYGGAPAQMAMPQLPQNAYRHNPGYPQPQHPAYQPNTRQQGGYWPADGQQGRVGGVTAPARSTAFGYPGSFWPTCGDFELCSAATTAAQPIQQTIYRGAR